jgi:hypothetical protein
MSEAAPAFVTIVMIPFTFDVGSGVIAGLAASLVCNASSRLRPVLHRQRWCSCCLAADEEVVDVEVASDIVANPTVLDEASESAPSATAANSTANGHHHTATALPNHHHHHHHHTSPLMHDMFINETEV